MQPQFRCQSLHCGARKSGAVSPTFSMAKEVEETFLVWLIGTENDDRPIGAENAVIGRSGLKIS